MSILGSEKINENGKILENILDNPRFLLSNDDSRTFFLNHRDYSSILDLFIISSNLGPFLNSFNVFEDDLLSDHFPIQLDLGFQFSEIDKNTKKKFNFKRADWEKFKSILGKSEINLDSDNIDEINSIITSTIFNA
ncbi:unnamed protein product, partial [Brachionus calyciflorus]